MERVWSRNLKEYDLKDGYSIEKAQWEEFSVYFAVYEIFKVNVWFRQSFDAYCSVLKDCDICFWIKKDNFRIGGVLLDLNYMNCLFLQPPHNEYDIIIGKLKKLLLTYSDNSKLIYVGAVKPDKVKYYQRAGFKIGESRRCMIRPTEEFHVTWDCDYEIVSVTEDKKSDIAKLFAEAFSNESKDGTSFEKENESVEFYFTKNLKNTLVNKASTLIYEKKTNELVGACLISIWEDWPNVYDIAVKPSFEKRGLARNMLKRALTVLKEGYPTLRLFVTLGNDAEMFYHQMGFLAGTETTEMILPVRESHK
ncbi:ribosomal protein S18 acetylase RimI-like enzyme [Clostridium punense]|uniref:Ribosomal protein S18 acetylase RimI-like enzyme n=1 Tax=Clostridium punense TaxID=1054297 RepID=A0ABS4K4M6_9CLOT|nr:MULTISPECIES: GNAT family N-acetyltransferase [Clostridium]EQB87883.1 hypothetical protein M918_07020 [Clostridium sp. BL8]MBP2022739.1 ribosomal protein S18 acetylase RimI-like enzyme [Clostridium punense]